MSRQSQHRIFVLHKKSSLFNIFYFKNAYHSTLNCISQITPISWTYTNLTFNNSSLEISLSHNTIRSSFLLQNTYRPRQFFVLCNIMKLRNPSINVLKALDEKHDTKDWFMRKQMNGNGSLAYIYTVTARLQRTEPQ